MPLSCIFNRAIDYGFALGIALFLFWLLIGMLDRDTAVDIPWKKAPILSPTACREGMAGYSPCYRISHDVALRM